MRMIRGLLIVDFFSFGFYFCSDFSSFIIRYVEFSSIYVLLQKEHTGRLVIGDHKSTSHFRSGAEEKKMYDELEHQYQQSIDSSMSGRNRRHCGLGFSECDDEEEKATPLPERPPRTESSTDSSCSDSPSDSESLSDSSSEEESADQARPAKQNDPDKAPEDKARKSNYKMMFVKPGSS
ncbi:hypothetical protein FKM82_018450 [Ascaphus truei]